MRKEKTKFPKGSEIRAFVFAFILFIFLAGCVEYQRQNLEGAEKKKVELVKVTELDFRPRFGNYQMEWNEVQFFDPIVKLESGAPEDFSLLINITYNQARQGNQTLGPVQANFRTGQTEAFQRHGFILMCLPNLGLVRLHPQLNPQISFFISHSTMLTIYPELTSLIVNQDLPNWRIANEAPRVEHTVTCGSTPPPSPCVTRADCNAGGWCINGQCKKPPLGLHCTPSRGCGDAGICVAARNNDSMPGGVDFLGRCDSGNFQLPGVECMCLQY